MNKNFFYKIMISGFFVIDKPSFVSSNYVGKVIRKVCNTKKTGHIGTLDPLASGVLTVAINNGTKLIPYITNEFKSFPNKVIKKTYEFDLTFGEDRETFDSLGKLLNENKIYPSQNEIENVLNSFIGEIKQAPPKFSAIKISGTRAYKLARSGKDFEIKKRLVNIFKIQMTEYKKNVSSFLLDCGAGTYVRSLAVDIASALNAIGHVSKLRRLHDGKFSIEDAISFDKISAECDNKNILSYMYGIESVLDDIPAVFVSESDKNIFLCGGAISFLNSLRDLKNDFNFFCNAVNEAGGSEFLQNFHSNDRLNSGLNFDEQISSLFFIFFKKDLIGIAKLKDEFLLPVRVFKG